MPQRPIIGITTDILKSSKHENNFSMRDAYAKAVARAGGIPILIPAIGDYPLALKDIGNAIDGLLLPGSRDIHPSAYREQPHPKLKLTHPMRTRSEMLLLAIALKRKIPILGICGGMQLINVKFGGTLYQDIISLLSKKTHHEKGTVHKIFIMDNSLLKDITKKKTLIVNSFHHQCVKKIGEKLIVAAKSSADGVIEAIESKNPFILGLQWHPERKKNTTSRAIFKYFIQKCMPD